MRSLAWTCLLVLLAGCGDDDASPDAAPAAADAGPDAGPPPMPAPDLRFKLVGAAERYVIERQTDVLPGLTLTLDGEYQWGPLELLAAGPGMADAGWEMFDYSPIWSIEGLESVAHSDSVDRLDDDLAATQPGPVITSIDIQNGDFAFVATSTRSGQPRYVTVATSMPRDQLDTFATDEGAAGRVITALSARSGAVLAMSATRPGETQRYETQVVDASAATLIQVAGQLAAGGYVVTALGEIGVDAFVLVGTRAAGESAARQLYSASDGSFAAPLDQGFAPVGYVFVDQQHILVLAEK